MILFDAPCITEHVAKKKTKNTQAQGIKLTATVSSDLKTSAEILLLSKNESLSLF